MNQETWIRKRLPRLFVLASTIVIGSAPISDLQAQLAFRADMKTVTARNTDVSDSPLAQRLFLDRTLTTPAPLGTMIWFVADFNGDGLPFERSGLGTVTPDLLFGGDDRPLFADIVDGDQAGTKPGQYKRVGAPIDVPGPMTAQQIKDAHIYVFLWSSLGGGMSPIMGATFGVLNLGVINHPAIGNPFWAVDRNIAADTFSYVPEPAEIGLAVAFGLLGVAVGLRRIRTRTSARE